MRIVPRTMRIAPRIFPVFAALLLLAGCAGYHVGPVQPTYMKGYHTIAVPSFHNDTLTPRLEVMMADAVIRQLQQDGTYEVGSESNSDLILQGSVTSIERSPLRALRGNVLATTEFQLDLKVSFTLTDRRTGKLVKQRAVIGTTTFFVGGDVQQDEQQALPLAAEKAAVQMVSYLSEGW